jgi:O-antigen/teichoic acid export membrane protein
MGNIFGTKDSMAYHTPSNLTFHNVFAGSALIFVITGVGLLLNFAFDISLARLLTPEDFGDFSIAMSLAFFWTAVALLGGDQSLRKFLPLYLHSDPAREQGLLRFYLLTTVAIGASIAIFGTLLAYFDVHVFTNAGFDSYHPLILALWLLPFICVIQLSSTVLQIAHFNTQALLPFKIVLPTFLLLSLWAGYLLGIRHSAWLILIYFAIVSFLVMLTQVGLMKKLAHITFHRVKRVVFEHNKWLTLSIPAMFTMLILAALDQVDLIMVEILDSAEGTVGLFAAASKIADWFFLLGSTLGFILLPYISVATTLRQRHKLLKRYTHSFLWPALALLVVCVLFGENLLGWFGPAYPAAYIPFIILGVGALIHQTFYCAMLFLLLYGYEKLFLMLNVSIILLDIGLNAILIPKFSIIGAAVASSASLILLALMIAVFTRLKFQIHAVQLC